MTIDKLTKGLLFGSLVLALGACNDGATDDTGDTDTDTDTQDTDTSPTYLEPYNFALTGFFGYDVSEDQIVAYSGVDANGTAYTQTPALLIELYEDGLTNENLSSKKICDVLVQQNAGGLASVTTFGDETALLGYQVDWTDAVIDTSGCDGLIDPEVWGEDLDETFKTLGFAIGIHGHIANATATSLKTSVDAADTNNEGLWTNEWEPYLVGGIATVTTAGNQASTLYWPGDANNPEQHYYFSRGMAVNESFEIIMSEGEPQMLASSDVVDTGPVDGAFPVQGFIVGYTDASVADVWLGN